MTSRVAAPRRGFLRRLVSIALTAALIAASASAVRAQQAGPQPASPAFEVLLTPYLWLPWTASNVSPYNTRIPGASNTVRPSTLISHLSWVPFMGTAEFRYGAYGVALDYVHAPVKTGVDSRAQIFSGATAGMTEDAGTAMFLYRAWAQPDQYFDVGAGVRAWVSPAPSSSIKVCCRRRPLPAGSAGPIR